MKTLSLKQITKLTGAVVFSFTSVLTTTIPAFAAWNINRVRDVEAVLNDMWDDIFQQDLQVSFEEPGIYDLSHNETYTSQTGTLESPCGVVNLAHYCLLDGNVYLDLVGLEELFAKHHGDAALVYVLAHEYAHAVQHRLNILENQTIKRGELQADCMAGIMFVELEERGMVNVKDIETAAITAYELGDYDFDHPDHHGTPIERQASFWSGYDAPMACFVE